MVTLPSCGVRLPSIISGKGPGRRRGLGRGSGREFARLLCGRGFAERDFAMAGMVQERRSAAGGALLLAIAHAT
jgi:hypothetical protein